VYASGIKLNGLDINERGNKMNDVKNLMNATVEISLNDAAFLAMTLRIAVQQDPSIATDHVKALYAKLVA